MSSWTILEQRRGWQDNGRIESGTKGDLATVNRQMVAHGYASDRQRVNLLSAAPKDIGQKVGTR